MKSLFMDTLPAEIRMLIYRELLRDKKSVLKPQGESHNDCIPKKNLYPAILGVCKQTYAEASAILYEENSFSYRYPYMCIEEGGESLYSVDPPPRGAFERIKKVSNTFPYDTLRLFYTAKWELCRGSKSLLCVLDLGVKVSSSAINDSTFIRSQYCERCF